MNEKLLMSLKELQNIDSIAELDEILDEIVPLLKKEGISFSQIMMFLKTGDGGFGVKSQDHRSTITNSHKAQIVLQKLMQKMKEK